MYDVCVIGSGAAGGVMAKELCEGGAKVILLEAGRKVTPAEFLSHKWPYQLPFRGLRGEKQAPFYPAEMSRSIRYDSCDRYVGVDRVRVLGGRTLHWNAVTLRYAPQDFEERKRAGVEDDWPVSYAELEPYYDRIERIIGVSGRNDHLAILPAGTDYLPPIPWRCSEHILQRATRSLGIPLISVRKAVLTKPYDNRPSCHYCGHCMEGCDASSIFTTPDCMLPKAAATGNLTLRTKTLARQILVDTEGRARGVSTINTETREEEEVRARIIVVCCATVESARLLLNSRSPRFPNGLANNQDVVGRYLHGHLTTTIHFYLSELAGTPPVNQDGATDHVYIPRYNQGGGRLNYVGGWGIQINFDSYMYPYQAAHLPGYGANFKQRVRWLQPGHLLLSAYAKTLAAPDNRVTVDRSATDEYGIPIPVVHYRFVENDHSMVRAAQTSLQEIGARLKTETVFSNFSDGPVAFASHEVGTIRMGKDPRTSVLNAFNQAHEVKNLFVTDGSAFTTSSEKNPTLTIMALSLRAADYIRESRRKGEL